jgi:putative DNA primase/helicase
MINCVLNRANLANNATQSHLDEWVKGSSVTEGITRLNLKSIDNPVAIANLLNWQKYLGTGGWYVTSCDPLTGKRGSFGQFKPDQPIVFPNQEKPQKYFSFPKDAESQVICLLLTLNEWVRISERFSVPIANEDIDESRDDLGFWQWVLNHPEIPILITEGAKKAACLLSCGWVALALTGVWNGQKKKKLHPSLIPFVVPGRPIDLVFDADVVVKESVQDALRVLGHLIHRAKGIVRIVTWDLQLGKGCDDFIVAHGPDEFEQIMNNATPYSEWLKKLEQQVGRTPSVTQFGKAAGTQKIPPADVIGREIIEDYRARLLWNDEQKTWMHYSLERSGVWVAVSEQYLESVVDAILESKGIIGYGSAAYVTNIVAKMRRRLFERVWSERSANEILPFTDGVLNLATGQLEPHAPGNRLTWCLPRPYNSIATGWTKIDTWLEQSTGTNSAHKEMLLCFAAAVLRGRCDLQKFLHLIGVGGSGKSTYTRLLEAVIGPQNCWNGSLTDLEDKHEVARLIGKRLVILPDQDKVTGSLSNFKRLTGQDTLCGRRLYKDGINFRFPGLAIVTSNAPIFHADGGSWLTRRILMLAFDHKPAAGQVKDLETEFEPELSAFTNYLLSIPNDEITRVLRRLGADGVSTTLWQSKLRTDSIAAWVNDLVIHAPHAQTQIGSDRHEWADQPYNPLISTLFGSYCHYCRISGLQAKGKNNFSADLIELVQQTLGWSDVQWARDATGRRVIRGLKLRADGDDAPFLEDSVATDDLSDDRSDDRSDDLKHSHSNKSDDSDDLLTLKLLASRDELKHNAKIDGAVTEIFAPPPISNPEPQSQLTSQVVSEVVSQVVGEVVSKSAAMAQPQKVSPESLNIETPVTNALTTLSPLETTTNSAAEGLPTKESPSTPPQFKQKQSTNRRLQPVEILNSAGDWVAGYFVHQCIAVVNLVGIEQKFTLFDADGGAYTFLGQLRPL